MRPACFRFDYRLNGRRETLVIGRYDPGLPARGARAADELSFGMSMRLAEARLLLERARREVEQGASPSRSKVEKRVEAAEAMTLGKWAEIYFAEATLAESTRAMRKSVYDWNLAAEFGRLKLEEITPSRLLMRCEKIKERGAAAPAVQARDIVLQVYRFVQARAEGSQSCRRHTALRYCYLQAARPGTDTRGDPCARSARPRSPRCVWRSSSCC